MLASLAMAGRSLAMAGRFFGAQYPALRNTLDPSSFGLPLQGLPAGFATDLLAIL